MPLSLFPLQVSKPVLNMLQRVEPYVAFGYPNLKSVRELIYKRGYAKVRQEGSRRDERLRRLLRLGERFTGVDRRKHGDAK